MLWVKLHHETVWLKATWVNDHHWHLICHNRPGSFPLTIWFKQVDTWTVVSQSFVMHSIIVLHYFWFGTCIGCVFFNMVQVCDLINIIACNHQNDWVTFLGFNINSFCVLFLLMNHTFIHPLKYCILVVFLSSCRLLEYLNIMLRYAW